MAKILPFGEWLPDQPQFANPGSSRMVNVVPLTAASYGPVASPVASGMPLPDPPVRGNYSFETATGPIVNFAATRQHLYEQITGSADWSDISKTGGYSTGADIYSFWQMTSFGKRIIATNYNDPIQTLLYGTDAQFSDLAAAAPRARYCAVIRDFLMVADTFDGTDGAMAHRLWWPAIGNPLYWPTPGTDAAIAVQSDFQDLQQTDLGIINGLVGGHLSATDGAALCERGIYRIAYAGSPAIFDFAVAQGARGTSSPLSIVTALLTGQGGVNNAVIYYLGPDDFYAYDGSSSVGIGAQKIARFFFADLDVNFLGAVQGALHPSAKLVFWLYHGLQNDGQFNRAIVYNFELGRWAPVDITRAPVSWLSGLTYSTGGYNLDELNPFGNLEQLKFSLDSRYWTNASDVLAWFDDTGQQLLLTGPSLEAMIETSEMQLFPGRRTRIKNTRPIGDSVAPVTIAVGRREKTRDPVVYTVDVPENILGECPQRTTGRYTRFRLTVPAGAGFHNLQGIDIDVRPEGTF